MRCVHVFRAASNYAQLAQSASERARFSHQRNEFGGILCELVRQLLVVGDEVRDVNVAVVLLHKHVLANLISIPPLESVRGVLTAALTCR